MKIVFVGTPDFASHILEHLVHSWNIVGVVTQPDRKGGRGRKVLVPPVKVVAGKYGIPLIQPSTINEEEAVEFIKSKDPDVLLVVAYGKILKETVLRIPKRGAYNVHASLLPKYRGAAPIQRAIENGERKTGITIFKMVKELDAGPIALQKTLEIGDFETFGDVYVKLIDLAKEAVDEFLKLFSDNKVVFIPQDDSKATYAPKIKKEDTFVNFSETSEKVKNKIRAYDPVPGARALFKNQIVKLFEVEDMKKNDDEGIPGKILKIEEKGAWIKTGDGKILLGKIQFPGKKVLSFSEAKNGRLIREGDILEGGACI